MLLCPGSSSPSHVWPHSHLLCMEVISAMVLKCRIPLRTLIFMTTRAYLSMILLYMQVLNGSTERVLAWQVIQFVYILLHAREVGSPGKLKSIFLKYRHTLLKVTRYEKYIKATPKISSDCWYMSKRLQEYFGLSSFGPRTDFSSILYFSTEVSMPSDFCVFNPQNFTVQLYFHKSCVTVYGQFCI